MAGRIRVEKPGGPEVLVWEDTDIPIPKAGEILIRHEAIGLNFIDTYHRSGLYPIPTPSPLGMEAAGVIEAVGDGVAHFKVGDKVGYCWGSLGAYATHRVLPADMAVLLPDDISVEMAAAVLLKGCTAEYLIKRTYPVKSGDKVLFHAAAGGVGLIACQWLKALSATVIGTAGSEEKADKAKAYGCDHVINYQTQNFTNAVKDLTNGRGVDVVFDGVGRDSWEGSLNCLRPRGMMVSFGNASGPVTGVDLGILAQKGSLYVTRPTLMHYYATAHERRIGSQALFEQISNGIIQVQIGQRYALKDAARAHKDLEARKTIGSTLLIPE